MGAATLVANPIPVDDEIPFDEIESAINDAVVQLEKHGVVGKKTTPFLLDQIVKKTGGRRLTATIALAVNKVKLGAEIAKELCLYKSPD